MHASNRLKKERLTYLITLLPERQVGARGPPAFSVWQQKASGRWGWGWEMTASQESLSHTLNQATSRNGRGKAFNSGYQLIFQD